VALVHPPDEFDATLGHLPDDVHLRRGLRRGQEADLIVGFFKERQRLVHDIEWLVKALPPDGALWVAWPKRASKVATDMTEQTVRDVALPMGWVDIKVCAIDDTWSGLKLVLRKELRP
jgi:hypothetical protein